MPAGSYSRIPWRDWSSEPPTPSPGAGTASAIRHMQAAGEVRALPVPRIGGTRLAVVGRARLYVCGITPYDATHVGHAATFVWADVAARVLRLAGGPVEVCRNITDVDEHLLVRARADHVPWRALASQQTYRFERDMAELGVAAPTYEPRSFDYVDEVVTLAAELLRLGLAYERDGTVYFRGAGVAGRSGLTVEEAVRLSAERGGHPDDKSKDQPLDSVLWRRAGDDEPAFPSPWGPGRPGWHAECAVMAMSTFGPTVDLHVGGDELAFPHHAYEAAMAEAFTGVAPFARAWMHVGSVTSDGRKMAKSAGNLVFVSDLLERFPPAALRLLILSRHWRDSWEFTERALDDAAGSLEGLWARAARPGGDRAAGQAAVEALLGDLNVKRALDVAADGGGQPLRDLLALLDL